MADPPWDIHMDLPYGTLRDDEMKNLPVRKLQDDGVIFLWVTGRALELGRDCLELWGYTRKEELVKIIELARKYNVTIISDELHCDINPKNKSLSTPLSWAAFNGQKSVVEFLLEKSGLLFFLFLIFLFS